MSKMSSNMELFMQASGQSRQQSYYAGDEEDESFQDRTMPKTYSLHEVLKLIKTIRLLCYDRNIKQLVLSLDIIPKIKFALDLKVLPLTKMVCKLCTTPAHTLCDHA